MPPPQFVTIQMLFLPGHPPSLTWSSTGWINDSGTWTDDGYKWAAVPSPVVGTLHQDVTLQGFQGTLKIQFQGVVTLGPGPGVMTCAGHWTVLGGTGGYV